MHIILTRPPKIFFSGMALYALKFFARIIFNKVGGPESVLQSLKRGLREHAFDYQINTVPKNGDTVHVISNIEALRYAIAQKKKGQIAKLIAGPNLVVMPDEYQKILTSPEIDKILIVSPWIKDLYDLVLPEVKNRRYIWPAGVRVPPINNSSSKIGDKATLSTDKKLSCIIFKKTVPENIFEETKSVLSRQQISCTIFEYGKFKQLAYFNALTKHDFMVYLQEHESQGIALQEAWIRNIPTLVWNKGTYKSPDGHVIVGNVAAPFLVDEAGMLFDKNADGSPGQTFEQALQSFTDKMKSSAPFTPREYCSKTLSDKASAQIYLDIIAN